jgi:hypothetical protein
MKSCEDHFIVSSNNILFCLLSDTTIYMYNTMQELFMSLNPTYFGWTFLCCCHAIQFRTLKQLAKWRTEYWYIASNLFLLMAPTKAFSAHNSPPVWHLLWQMQFCKPYKKESQGLRSWEYGGCEWPLWNWCGKQLGWGYLLCWDRVTETGDSCIGNIFTN